VSEKLKERLISQITQAVEGKLGNSDPSVAQLIAEEVGYALAKSTPSLDALSSLRESDQATERVVVTANGRNHTGIVAKLSACIDEYNGDIQDISQTIVNDYFTMIFVVDISDATSKGTRFMQLKHRLEQVGADMGIHVVALHDDILSSMHTV
jgi:ACT domain-containing protein